MATYFDDSLGVLAKTVSHALGADALARGVVLRDTSGRLCFFSISELADEQYRKLTTELTENLGAYARIDRVVANPDDFGTADMLNSSEIIPLLVGGLKIRLVDRRLVGADWLRN